MDLKQFIKKIEPLIAIGIFILLLILVVQLYQDNQLKKEIGENCGYESKWGGTCYCDKQTVYDKKIELENKQKGDYYLNVSLDR